MSVETAKRLGIPTIGVFPKQGTKYALLSQLDLAIETSPPDIGDGTFGTETPAFVNMLDGATVVGGGYGTLTEISTILKTNTKRARDRSRGLPDAQDPIYFAPITSTGGAAASVYNLTHNLGGDVETSLGMPISPATDGHDAAKFIYDRLNAGIEQLIGVDLDIYLIEPAPAFCIRLLHAVRVYSAYVEYPGHEFEYQRKQQY